MNVDSLEFFAGIAREAIRAPTLEDRIAKVASAPRLRRFDGAQISWETARRVLYAGMFAEKWISDGRQVYQLNHSIAALLSATRSVPIEWEHLPHTSFLIDVPQEFCPAFADKPGGPPPRVLIAVGRIGGCNAFGVISKNNLATFGISDGDQKLEEEVDVSRDPDAIAIDTSLAQHAFRIAVRLASNTIRFVTQHRECVRRPAIRRRGDTGSVFTVRPPEGVSIDKKFRDLAAALVSSTSLGGARRVLAHLVRGHWRNQAVGPGRGQRRLTWVMPHRRGDESLGAVVSRIERLQARPSS
jgi:hypothetical protein